ncbi:MAG: 2-hydroxyacyl-CoA dehydratase [Desulfobacteraceae bacterium]|nr:MAG: 2-hydroxyacyl-CoA dehydratase [Desulfobacteraceae bacterium]
MSDQKEYIGFACAYTPLPVIYAAGYTPYRILPMGDSPDQAGHILHDNLCPHIKRILDRAINNDLPDLAGVVFMNSCDAMRRLADAWHRVRPDDNMILLDLPASADVFSISYFTGEILRLIETVSKWSGKKIKTAKIEYGILLYNQIADYMNELAGKIYAGKTNVECSLMQDLFNRSVTGLPDTFIEEARNLLSENRRDKTEEGVPVFLFGHVLPDPEAFMLFQSCGAKIIGDDLCTGSRMFNPVATDDKKGFAESLAKSLLLRPPCARTIDSAIPGKIGKIMISKAKESGARGAIAHVVKFCDPYLSRLPSIREEFQKAGMPLLVLEGDCTLRSIGQQQTRIEAFIEMLK